MSRSKEEKERERERDKRRGGEVYPIWLSQGLTKYRTHGIEGVPQVRALPGTTGATSPVT